jgi:hypothetical protein
MITRDGFYVAFNKLKEMNELLDKISDGLDTDMSDSAVGDMLDNAFEMFIALLDGDEYLEEALYMAVFEEKVYIAFDEDDVYILPFDKYYDYFVLKEAKEEWVK